MPFARPTLTELRDQARTDFGVAARLRYSNERILADVVAGHAQGHYGYLDWIAKQANPFTATGEYAEAWGALKDVFRKPATAATGSVLLTGVSGTPIPVGSVVSRVDGVAYATAADAEIGGGGSISVAIEAVSAGASGDADDGTPLTLGAAIPGVNSTGAADGPLTGGADVERADDFKSRYLAAYAAPPQGGDSDDYPRWAREVPGVTRAWCRPYGAGVGTVVVYFMMGADFPVGTDGASSGELRDVAATGDQLAVADYIFNGRQPVTALVYAVAPQANTVALTVTGATGWSAALKASVQGEIDAVFQRDGDPTGATVNLSSLEAAIAAIPGTSGFVVTAVSCTHGSISPAAGNITSAVGYLPVRGVVTWA